jgi:hypothetical protein
MGQAGSGVAPASALEAGPYAAPLRRGRQNPVGFDGQENPMTAEGLMGLKTCFAGPLKGQSVVIDDCV